MLLFAHKVMLALPGLVKRSGSNDLVWVSHTFSIYGGLRKIRTCGLGCRLGRVRTGATGAFPPLRPNGALRAQWGRRTKLWHADTKTGCHIFMWHPVFVSARQDLNLRPLRPERSALPNWATRRFMPFSKHKTYHTDFLSFRQVQKCEILFFWWN